MKKKIIPVLALLVVLSGCTRDSKEFTFSWDLLDSLYSCETALYYMEQSQNAVPDISNMMAEEMSANSRFNEAKISMDKYAKDKNEFIRVTAKGVVKGIDLLLDANNKSIQQIRQISNYDQKGFDDLDYKVAEINSQRKEGWRLIALSASFLLPVIMEGAKNENPAGPIPFKISKEERERLLKRLNSLFGKTLQRFDNYYALKKKGLEGNPEDLTWLSFTIDRIRDMLSAETYEEAKNKKLDD